MTTTKIYRNTGTDDLSVIGIGDIPAGEQVSISSEYHQPVVLANYPGLVEITAEGYVEEKSVDSPVATPVSINDFTATGKGA